MGLIGRNEPTILMVTIFLATRQRRNKIHCTEIFIMLITFQCARCVDYGVVKSRMLMYLFDFIKNTDNNENTVVDIDNLQWQRWRWHWCGVEYGEQLALGTLLQHYTFIAPAHSLNITKEKMLLIFWCCWNYCCCWNCWFSWNWCCCWNCCFVAVTVVVFVAADSFFIVVVFVTILVFFIAVAIITIHSNYEN